MKKTPLPHLQWTVDRFLDQLESSVPVPGSGSAAALVGCLGTDLGRKVCRILLNRPRIQGRSRAAVGAKLRSLGRISRRLRSLVRQDAQAYLALARTFGRPGGISAAARRRAAGPPLKIARLTAEADRILKGLAPWAGAVLRSDVTAGRALLRGAREAAGVTARINLR